MAQSSQNNTPPYHFVNPANPFYLHLRENPAETKNQERFVSGSIPCPPINDPLHDAWF